MEKEGSMDVIYIEDLPQNSNIIIDVDEDNSDVETLGAKNQEEQYKQLASQEKLLWEFIEKCLQVDTTEKMQRVVNKSLIPIYKKTSKEFRVSSKFNRLITRAKFRIEYYPYLKFYYIKELCNNLKSCVRKEMKINQCNVDDKVDMNKKTGVSNIYNNKDDTYRNKYTTKNVNCKEVGDDVIEVDDTDDGFALPVINIIDKNNHMSSKHHRTKESNKHSNGLSSEDVAIIDTVEYIQIDDESEICSDVNDVKKQNQNIPIIEITLDEEKENNNTSKNVAMSLEPQTICLSDDETSNDHMTNSQPQTNNVEKLLVPQREEISTNYSKKYKIERDIQYYKTIINKLDNEEVMDDTNFSPYIQSERFKRKLVLAYQELCELTGEKPVKRREVRLKAMNARSQLSVRKLEEFINNNIGSDGLPHFPDIWDVFLCVRDANRTGNLGWTPQIVLKEARTLFECCGKALQRDRQRREWRDMMNLVKQEVIEDPADTDPELNARLLQNKRQASAKEEQLLEKYSQMHEERIQKSYQKVNKSNQQIAKDNLRITPINVPSSSHEVAATVMMSNQVSEDHNRISEPNNVTISQPNVSLSNSDAQNTLVISNVFSLSAPKCDSDNTSSSVLIGQESNLINSRLKQEHISDSQKEAELESTLSERQPKQTSNTINSGVEKIPTLSNGDSGNLLNNSYKVPSNNVVVETDNKLVSGEDNGWPSQNLELIDEQSDARIKTELDKSCKDKENNSIVNYNVTNSPGKNTAESSKILEHFLKARVELTRMPKDTENAKSNIDTSDNYQCVEENKELLPEESGIKIKKEPWINIQHELDQLGDNYTTTIFGIEDPFLVVEISSESSDGSEDEMDNEELWN